MKSVFWPVVETVNRRRAVMMKFMIIPARDATPRAMASGTLTSKSRTTTKTQPNMIGTTSSEGIEKRCETLNGERSISTIEEATSAMMVPPARRRFRGPAVN